MQFQFRELPLEAQQEPAIGRARVINAIGVGDEAVLIAADIEQRIPIGTVTAEAGDVIGEEETNAAEGDPGGPVFKTPAGPYRGATYTPGRAEDLPLIKAPAPGQRSV